VQAFNMLEQLQEQGDIEEKTSFSCPTIDKNSRFKTIWDTITDIVLFISLFLVPYHTGFGTPEKWPAG
jgi:hypothetical protein